MTSKSWTILTSITAAVGVLCITVNLFADTDEEAKNRPNGNTQSASTDQPDDEKLVTVAVARERAKLTHEIYAATLDVMHHRYFRDDRSSVPARAMEDVFSKIALQENIKARWIAVNAKPMNINHRPQNDFEKQAAKAIAAGQPEYEFVANGIYRRASSISLMNRGCLRCHLDFGESGKIKRFAGLVITIPVTKD